MVRVACMHDVMLQCSPRDLTSSCSNDDYARDTDGVCKEKPKGCDACEAGESFCMWMSEGGQGGEECGKSEADCVAEMVSVRVRGLWLL